MKGKRKNILLVIPSLGGGGAQNVFRQHYKAFSPNHNVYRVIFNRDIVLESESELISLDVPSSNNFFRKIFNFYLRCVRLKKIKKDYAIDICISHLEGADYVNILSKSKEAVILCIHGSKIYDRNINGVIGWIRKKILIPTLYKRANKIITVSEGIRSELISQFKIDRKKTLTIYNYFEIENISKEANEPIEESVSLLFENYFTIVVFGRLVKEKKFDKLLKVISRVKRKVEVKLIIIGDGEERNHLLSLAVKLKLLTFSIWGEVKMGYHYDVYFLGFKKNPFKYVQKCNIFVLSSRNEGFSMALGEAMACGLPIIATDCPTGPREMLAPDTPLNYNLKEPEFADYGILMPIIGDSTGVSYWVETLAHVSEHLVLRERYAAKSKERIKDFSKEKIICKWHQVLEEEF